jgi:hypothetical protein
MQDVETGGLLIGCTLIAIGYVRNGLAEIDVYPSRTVLQSSFTLLLAGGYLFVVGVLAKLVAHLGGAGSFQTQTFLILLELRGSRCCYFPTVSGSECNNWSTGISPDRSTTSAASGD